MFVTDTHESQHAHGTSKIKLHVKSDLLRSGININTKDRPTWFSRDYLAFVPTGCYEVDLVKGSLFHE